MKKKAASIVLLMMILLPVFSGTDGQGLPGEHLDSVAHHEAKFTVQAYKRNKDGSSSSEQNTLALQVFDQISFRSGALGEIKANAKPTNATSAVLPTNMDPYLSEFFGDGVTVAVINLQGYVAPGQKTQNPQGWGMFPHQQRVTLSVTPYSPTSIDSATGAISSVGTEADPSFVNVERNQSIPISLSLVEMKPFLVEMPDNKVNEISIPAGGGTQAFGSKAYSHGFYGNYIYYQEHGNYKDLEGSVSLDESAARLSISLTNNTTFHGSHYGNDLGYEGGYGDAWYEYRRAFPWEYSVGIRIKSGIDKTAYDNLPSGRYTAVLNIVVSAE